MVHSGPDPPVSDYQNGGYMRFAKSSEIRLGSLWRDKNNLAAYYFSDRPYCYYCEDSCTCNAPIGFLEMSEETILMLVKHEIVGNRHQFWLLGCNRIYEDLSLPVGTWDNVFVEVLNKPTK